MRRMFFDGSGKIIDQNLVPAAKLHLEKLEQGKIRLYGKMLQDENVLRKIAGAKGLIRIGSPEAFLVIQLRLRCVQQKMLRSKKISFKEWPNNYSEAKAA